MVDDSLYLRESVEGWGDMDKERGREAVMVNRETGKVGKRGKDREEKTTREGER